MCLTFKLFSVTHICKWASSGSRKYPCLMLSKYYVISVVPFGGSYTCTQDKLGPTLNGVCTTNDFHES